MLAVFIPVAVFVSIITFILMIVMSSSKKTEKEKLHMIKAIYFYAISFITLIMVIGGGISLFIAASDLVSPTDTSINAHAQALNSLVKSFGWIVIPGPIFYFTQRRIREIRAE
jgi:dipeptide/tripeptide permease